MSMELYPHNEEAYGKTRIMMQERGRAAVVHPTGTGKSFIAFRLVEENPKANICWLAPSEYIFQSQKEAFLKAGGTEEELTRVTFLTYARLLWNEDNIPGLTEQTKPDYIILDEFHRCGAAEWGRGVKKLLDTYPEAKILGLSATNVRYLDAGRDMAEELFDGLVASRMNLGEAIAREILPAPVYVTAFYSYAEEVKKLEARVASSCSGALRRVGAEQLEKLRRSLQNAEGPEQIFERWLKKEGKYILFCADKDHMDEMLEKAGMWFGGLDPQPHIYQAYYENTGSFRAFREFSKDRSSHLKLLFCIDMLNEGIHVEGVDGVVLLRPTVSPTLYLQQVGRALSAAGKRQGKSAGQPVILDMVNNFDSLCCIDSLREEVQKALSGFSESAKRSAGDSFRVIDEVRDVRLLFEEIRRSLTAGWELYFQEAQRYYEEFGDLRVPKRYLTKSGIALGNWIVTQRRIRAGSVPGDLTEEQIEKLDRLGMIWESRSEENWETGYRELLEYRRQHGDADVAARYIAPSGYALGRWVANQRARQNDSEKGLSAERIRRLDEIGFVWEKREYDWERYYRAAISFYQREGHLDVPVKYRTEEGLHLGSWIQGKRQKKKVLSTKQIRALDAIGMIWEGSRDSRFEEKYRLAKHFYEEKGHLDIPADYTAEGVKLGRWICALRSVRSRPGTSNYRLTEERINRLDAIGMIWRQDSWEVRYRLAEKYYREHGNLKIPQSYIAEGNIWLGKWLAQQKRNYHSEERGKALSEDRAKKLETIGMTWDGS